MIRTMRGPRFGLRLAQACVVLILIGAGSWTTIAFGRDYYVSPSGDNHNDGSISSPLRKINKAASRARPGDTIYVEDGVYHESVYIQNSGAPGAWIKFQSFHPHGALVAPLGQGTGSDAFNVNSQSFIEINGFEITAGPKSQGVAAGWGGVGHHTRVINNVVHDCGASGIQLNNGDYRIIENNIVYHNGLLAPWSGSGVSIYEPVASDLNPGFHNVVRNNIAYLNDNAPGGTDGNGIIIDDFHHRQDKKGVPYTQAALVENNLSFGNGGAGIQVFESDHVTIRNNTCVFNWRRYTESDHRGELSNVRSSDNVWVNNIGWSNPASDSRNVAVYEAGPRTANVLWRDNLAFDGADGHSSLQFSGIAEPSGFSRDNLLGRNPMFVNPAPKPGADFHLRPGSPAIGAGTAQFGVPGDDLGGIARPSGKVDLGAYAYIAPR
jgi:parallel beta-helix repeat protein